MHPLPAILGFSEFVDNAGFEIFLATPWNSLPDLSIWGVKKCSVLSINLIFEYDLKMCQLWMLPKATEF